MKAKSVLDELEAYVKHVSFKNVSQEVFDIASDLKSIYFKLDDFDDCFSQITLKELEYYINYFSTIDHLFSTKVLKKVASEEQHQLLSKAIYNFGQYFARMATIKLERAIPKDNKLSKKENCLFLVKGPYNLAHTSFSKAFYLGHNKISEKLVNPRFAFLDDTPPDEIKQISFNLSLLLPFKKLVYIWKLIKKYEIGTLIWLSVSQDLSLYMGSRIANQQIYWSARYRNNLMNSIDKYFFGAREKAVKIQYNGEEWCYGRFLVAEWKGQSVVKSGNKCTDIIDQRWHSFIMRKKKMGFKIIGTISNSRKMQSTDFHDLIKSILNNNSNLYYFYTSLNECCPLEKFLNQNGLSNRFKRIDWIREMTPLLGLFDLILDSFPVGASHALCYSVQAGTPFISMITTQNRQSSLLETMTPLIINEYNNMHEKIGFYKSIDGYTKFANDSLCETDKLLTELLVNQRTALSKVLANPIGMYEDFSSHILS